MIALLIATSFGLNCPVDRSNYIMRHHADISMRFVKVDSGPDWPSNLAMVVSPSSLGNKSWWLPWNGGTDGLQNIASTTDVTKPSWKAPSAEGGSRPYGDRQYIGMKSDYNLIDHAPVLGEPAPAHILLPSSGGAGDSSFPWRDFFDLVSCG